MEAWQQSLSQQWKPCTNIIFNSLEKALYLWDAFKLCASRGWGAVSNSQAIRGLENLLGKLESYQRGFYWNIPFKCRRLKPWVDFFPENIRRVEKQSTKASRFLVLGVHAQEMPGGTPEVWSRSCVCQLLPSWPCQRWDSSRWLPAPLHMGLHSRGTPRDPPQLK